MSKCHNRNCQRSLQCKQSCCDKKCEQAPCLYQLIPPVPSDYTYWNLPLVPNPVSLALHHYDFTKKGEFYTSSLMKDTDLVRIINPQPDYMPDYFPRNTDVVFPPGAGVPGPFPYEWPWVQWGGDEKYNFGTKFYTGILGHFGHTHILSAVFSQIMALRQNKCASVLAQQLMMKHLVNGSTQIFKWFAQLVDSNGNPIPYNPSTPAGALKALMDMLITGAGTSAGVINGSQLIGSFQFFLNAFGPLMPPIYVVKIQEIINQLSNYINSIFAVGKINIMAWLPLMDEHQKMVFGMWEKFRDFYCLSPTDHSYHSSMEDVNHYATHLLEGANQMCGFFSIFYYATNFLDVFLDAFGVPGPQAVPEIYRQDRLDIMVKSLYRYWSEHMLMFIDLDKACALCECAETQETIYKVQVNMLESCSYLELPLGEVFRAFDMLIRNRNLYSNLPPSFP